MRIIFLTCCLLLLTTYAYTSDEYLPIARMIEAVGKKMLSRGETSIAVLLEDCDDGWNMLDTAEEVLDERLGLLITEVPHTPGIGIFRNTAEIKRLVREVNEADAVLMTERPGVFFDLYDALRYFGLPPRKRIYWIQRGGSLQKGRLYGRHSVITICPDGICGITGEEMRRWLECDSKMIREGRLKKSRPARACWGVYLNGRPVLFWIEN